MSRLSVLLLFCVLLPLCTPANAAGFLIHENSAETVGLSYAGSGSRADGPDTVFANPAGMTRLERPELEVGAVGVLPSMSFNGSARQNLGQAGSVPIAGNNGAEGGSALVPNLYGVLPLGDGFAAGLALTVPFGLSTSYDPGWYGRYLGIKTSAQSADINPNIAYKIDETWSVGAGFSAQYLKLDATNGINQAAIFGVPAPDAYYRFKAHDWAFGFNGGVLAQFENGIRVGLTYRSGIDHQIEGSLDFTGASPLLGLINGPASAKTRLPATTGLSITDEIDPRISLYADVQFTQWSVFKDVVIESKNPPFPNVEGYRDSWTVAAGGSYRLDDDWTLRSGIAFDQTPVTSRFRAVTLPDTDRYLLSVGAAYRLSETVTVEGAYEHSFAFNSPNMNSSVNNTDPITHSVTLNGRYDVAVDILAVSLRLKL